MISNQQLEQNLQQGEIAFKESALRGTCRAIIGCGIATAALFLLFFVVALSAPTDETAPAYSIVIAAMAVVLIVCTGTAVATIVLGIVYGIKCRKLARLKAQFANRFSPAANAASFVSQPISAEPQTERSAAQQEGSGTNSDQEE